jgi:TatD DNase family protein
MYYDTHAHFEKTEGPRGAEALVPAALAAGVDRILAVGGSCPLNRGAVAAARLFPGAVAAAIGFDRDQAPERARDHAALAAAMQQLDENMDALGGQGLAVVAVGETGLDLHYSPETADRQSALLGAQADLALRRGLPLIVHSREADEATLEALAPYAAACRARDRLPGVLHCFTGSWPFAAALLDVGFFLSFSGIVTFRNADDLRETARRVPEDRLLIETDTPFLTPAPHRGRPNEPALVVDVARGLAAVRGVPLERLAVATSANARRLFHPLLQA